MVTKEQEYILDNLLPYGRFNEWMEKGDYRRVYLFIIETTQNYSQNTGSGKQ